MGSGLEILGSEPRNGIQSKQNQAAWVSTKPFEQMRSLRQYRAKFLTIVLV